MGNKYVVLFQRICFFVAFMFIALFISRNGGELIKVARNLNYVFALLALLLSFCIVFASTLQFKFLLEANKIPTQYWFLFRQRALTNMLNYIPGGVWSHVNLAISLSQQVGASVKTLSKLTALFMISVIITGTLFSIFFFPLYVQIIALVLVVFAFITLNYWITCINRLWKMLLPRVVMLLPPFTVKARAFILISGVLSWTLTAGAFVSFLYAAHPSVSVAVLFYAGSAYIVAWVVGLLAIPFPSGLGIREGVMGYLLALVGVPIAYAVAISLVFRVMLLIRDIIFFVIVSKLKLSLTK
ncbi:hypothetical protein COU89_02830 [Candidatus Roizmanbacteria bacterium CG10_big_fil_rev_8_21_14_0_10_45_7]|uniref:Lysylphosphatidylglycerol synthetase family protein n=1 Tax=Candidatus Roizmanbacteria bacterium CG10_big_fil_rev_8_21_14_0_10_45_7 TaxID=1974854 RepID=A0A2M8KUG3_9BACT|nr:MAG: hypothetical protein COU89_02830 [Candidatus Roizmanbacteria bacterium CG10_big_fil_rev_8_21_14_0_10_45_7]